MEDYHGHNQGTGDSGGDGSGGGGGNGGGGSLFFRNLMSTIDSQRNTGNLGPVTSIFGMGTGGVNDDIIAHRPFLGALMGSPSITAGGGSGILSHIPYLQGRSSSQKRRKVILPIGGGGGGNNNRGGVPDDPEDDKKKKEKEMKKGGGQGRSGGGGEIKRYKGYKG